MLPSCVALSPDVSKREIPISFGLLYLHGHASPPSHRFQKDWVWTSPGVYLVFPISWFLIGFRCEYPIEALNK